MTNLRKEARGRECQVQDIMAYAMATLKLQFWRITEWLEFAEREQSQMICWLHWACSDCHNEIDRRTRILDNNDARLYHLEGVIRTLAILLKEGKIKS